MAIRYRITVRVRDQLFERGPVFRTDKLMVVYLLEGVRNDKNPTPVVHGGVQGRSGQAGQGDWCTEAA